MMKHFQTLLLFFVAALLLSISTHRPSLPALHPYDSANELSGKASHSDLMAVARHFEDALNNAKEAGLLSSGKNPEDDTSSSSVVVSSIYGSVKFKCVGVAERSEDGLRLHERAVVGVRPHSERPESPHPGWHPRSIPLGGAVQVDPGFTQLTLPVLSTLETEI